MAKKVASPGLLVLPALWTVTAEVVVPRGATVLTWELRRMPTAHLFILVLLQKEPVYLACWLICFLHLFLR